MSIETITRREFVHTLGIYAAASLLPLSNSTSDITFKQALSDINLRQQYINQLFRFRPGFVRDVIYIKDGSLGFSSTHMINDKCDIQFFDGNFTTHLYQVKGKKVKVEPCEEIVRASFEHEVSHFYDNMSGIYLGQDLGFDAWFFLKEGRALMHDLDFSSRFNRLENGKIDYHPAYILSAIWLNDLVNEYRGKVDTTKFSLFHKAFYDGHMIKINHYIGKVSKVIESLS